MNFFIGYPSILGKLAGLKKCHTDQIQRDDKSMNNNELTLLVRIRLIVGYLGEHSEPKWWPSSFFASRSQAFLIPVFGKTSFMVQYYGVKESATRVHDEHIGIGRGVYHLFRLPEAIEQQLHNILINPEIKIQSASELSAENTALNTLEGIVKTNIKKTDGPIRVGSQKDIENIKAWQTVAGHYYHTFLNNNKTFPFFSEVR